MNRLTAGLVALALACAGAGAANAASPIPIDGPIVITQSGNYIVTRDICDAYPAVRMGLPDEEVDIDVAIDLDGHSICGVVVRGYPDGGGCRTLSMRNGRLVGGLTSSTGLGGGCNDRVYLHSLTIQGFFVSVEDGLLSVTSSRLINADLISYNNRGGAVANIVGNRLVDSSIILAGSNNSHVFDNVIERGSIDLSPSNDGWNASGVVAGNTITEGSIISDWRGGMWGTGPMEIMRNYIGGHIEFSGLTGSSVVGNDIYGCSPSGSAIVLGEFSQFNRIDDNRFLGRCAHGIEFGEHADDNEYSGNTFRVVVPVPIVDHGERNGPGLDVAPE
jgi:hypothetical protein